jgi:hypothetical protein
LADEILRLENPMWAVGEFFSALAKPFKAKVDQTPFDEMQKKMEQRRAVLLTHSVDALRQYKAKLIDQAQFYRKPGAQANFDHWLSMDFWSLDEAIALLMGSNPTVVTWEAVSHALQPPKSHKSPLPVSTPFLQRFEQLRQVAQRSEAMTASVKLTPVVVARWGQRMLGAELPKPLQELLEAATPEAPTTTEAKPQPMAETMDKAGSEPVLVKRKALLALEDIWPTVDSDLRNSVANKLGDAAKSDVYGMWKEHEALEWARRNGKLVKDARTATPDSLANYIHRMVR